MGFGDVKMIAMIGAFTGWQLTWLTILIGSLVGALVGGGYIFVKGRGSRYELPFGTFLGIAAILVVFAGTNIIDWYFGRLLP
jgi:prepilin signal peptidase PulO-like enzyme (type II secretory pathway)